MVRKLDAGTKTFECGGHKYVIRETLSFNRFEKLKEFSLEFGFSATFKDIFMNLKKVWEHMNKLQLGEAAVIVHNIMKGITLLEQKNDVSFRIAALFINEEGEDDTVYDELRADEKIAVWGKELEASFFLNFAAALVSHWIAAYKLTLEDISERAEKTVKSNIST